MSCTWVHVHAIVTSETAIDWSCIALVIYREEEESLLTVKGARAVQRLQPGKRPLQAIVKCK